MLTAYLDASGTTNQPVYVLAGFIGYAAQWKKFGKEWQRLLQAENVEMFHASDLESRQGKYRGWTRERQERFQRSAYSIVNRYRDAPISTGIVKRDFNFGFAQLKPKRAANFYVFCGYSILVQVSLWLKQNSHAKGPIQYVFEAGDEGHGEVDKLFSKLYRLPKSREQFRIGGWSFQNKRHVPQLQAADIWAYEVYKHLAEQDHISRDSYAALYDERFADYNGSWSQNNLDQFGYELLMLGGFTADSAFGGGGRLGHTYRRRRADLRQRESFGNLL